jgi:hypothetical protein
MAVGGVEVASMSAFGLQARTAKAEATIRSARVMEVHLSEGVTVLMSVTNAA